jgi:hypothetical protein
VIVDLDKLMASPDDSLSIRADLQSDHLHFSPKGNKMVVADLMTLEVLFGANFGGKMHDAEDNTHLISH